MKAFLLAAGLGTRLRPITNSTPKCLVRVGDRTLLDIWLDAMAGAGIDEVLVNLHHLADQVRTRVTSRVGAPMVHLVQEPRLLGSAGTLRANRDFVRGEEFFLAVNADNLTDFDLSVLVDGHRSGGAIATLTTFRAARPRECGIVQVKSGQVVGYIEKPAEPHGDLANAGMYAFHPDVLEEIPEPLPRDVGTDLLPGLVGRARAVPIGDCFFMDIGTSAALERARTEWKDRVAS